ncbi:MAG: hypothetical protein NDI77_15120, partial [Geobacteraceae bacterium]|nr:hypothetical protein [Geobacteraceae bacterium]
MAISRFFLSLLLAALTLLSGISPDAEAGGDSISIMAPPELLASPVTRTSIDDLITLLRRGFPAARVSLNDRSARVRLILPAIPPSPAKTPRFARGRGYPYLAYPDHDYEWRSTARNGKVLLTLRTGSFQGASFALYGLLQEKLGFRFYHPKRTLIPNYPRWPLPSRFRFSATPRFDKKGFHLHSLHPIELAEQLHDPSHPDALAEVKEYIDWLARNQQNVMQFYLLRDIDRERWIGHARVIVDYAHRRGVLAGVQISIAMLQQQAFQAVSLLRPYPSYRRQVDRTLAWLFRANWDFVTIEPTMGEYLPDLGRLMPGVATHLAREIRERYHATPLLASHVIRRKGEKGGIDGHASAIDPDAGVLLHTVMCYSASEQKAPVYGNVNQRFVLERAERENRRRETWYWPESAYWVAFDNSVPLFLLPYLDARWSDMEAMERTGVPNHLTFSSGWEWGYWLFDWSIARWSWRYADNGKPGRSDPLGPLRDLFPDQSMGRLWREALRLQNHYLKERELLRFMAAMTPFSELPPPFAKPFQPAPEFGYAWLLREAMDDEAERVLQGPVAALAEYAEKMEQVAGRLEKGAFRTFAGATGEAAERKLLAEELTRGLRVTALRARHRALTIRAIIAKRHGRGSGGGHKRLLAEAAMVRAEAQKLVLRQEAIYRYSPEQIARKRKSLTAYQFGYLYPVSDLFFWQREEEQARRGRFDPLFMNL